MIELKCCTPSLSFKGELFYFAKECLKENIVIFFRYFFSRGMYQHAFMTFISCFSSKENMLSQWRAYGGNGDKFCLRFSGDKLLDVVRDSISGFINEDDKL